MRDRDSNKGIKTSPYSSSNWGEGGMMALV